MAKRASKNQTTDVDPTLLDAKVKAQIAAEPADVEKQRLDTEKNVFEQGPVHQLHGPVSTVVIPYLKSKAIGEELKYSVRAWRKNLPDCKIVVIGDAEDWFSDELTFIPAPVVSENPQVDVAAKMFVAIASSEVSEEFIWSNDDIVPICRVHLSDISLLKSNGLLSDNKQVATLYNENRSKTIDVLKTHRNACFDYSTHTPFLFTKRDLVSVFEKYQVGDQGYLISSLYYNTVFNDYRPIKITGGMDCNFTAYIYRPDVPKTSLEKVFAERKYINYNDKGYPLAIARLAELFPDKCDLEV